METVYWKQRNGELISVDDMDVNHLRNVLKMLIRNERRIDSAKTYSLSERFTLNGEIAQYMQDLFVEREYYQDIDDQF
jgi:hypothetical protein